MLSAQEQRSWEEIRRRYEAEAEEPGRLDVPSGEAGGSVFGVDDLPAAVVAGWWTTIFLVLFGAVAVGLAVGGLTALGWWLWHRRSLPAAGGGAAPPAPPVRDPGP